MSRVKQSAKLAAAAVALIGGFEGLRLTAYIPVPGDVPTACYGETRGIRLGMRFSKRECDDMFVKRLDEFGAKLEACIPAARADAAAHGLAPMSDDVYTGFLSLEYNIGSAGFCRSSVARLYKAGDLVGACEAMRRFNRAGGKVLAGLDRRRKAEERLCLGGL